MFYTYISKSLLLIIHDLRKMRIYEVICWKSTKMFYKIELKLIEHHVTIRLYEGTIYIMNINNAF